MAENRPGASGSWENWTRESIPEFERPASSSPADRVVGQSELGPVYETISGEKYHAQPNPDQRTTRGKIEDWAEEGFPLPSKEETWSALKSIPKEVYSSIDRSVKGTGTLGDVFGVAPAMAGLSLPFEAPKGSLRIFGGIRGDTAPIKDLPVVGEKKWGETFTDGDLTVSNPREQWSDTPWFQGPDGKFRYEIDTTDFAYKEFKPKNSGYFTKEEFLELRPEYSDLTASEFYQVFKDKWVNPRTMEVRPASIVPLKDLLSGEELFKAYPDLNRIIVELDPGLPRDSAYYRPDFDVIALNPHDVQSGLLEGLTHELQHAVQAREGFLRGSSPRAASGFEIVAKKEKKWAEELSRAHRGYELGKISKEVFEEKLYRVAVERRLFTFNVYERVYGEAEANAAVARMNLTPTERREMFPEDSYILSPRNRPKEKIPLIAHETGAELKRHYRNGGAIPKTKGSNMADDAVQINAHEGEYVMPREAVEFYGLDKLEKMTAKAQEGYAGMETDGRIGGEDFAEGGKVEPFDVTDWTTPGATYFDTPAPTPVATGVTEYRTYTNANGQLVSILFVDGVAQQPIPDGYSPRTEATADTPDRDDAEQRRLEEEDTFNPENNYFTMSEEKLTKVGERGSGIFSGVLGLFGGPLGGIIKNAVENNRMSSMQTAYAAAVERGLTDTAASIKARIEAEGGSVTGPTAPTPAATGGGLLDSILKPVSDPSKKIDRERAKAVEDGGYVLPTASQDRDRAGFFKDAPSLPKRSEERGTDPFDRVAKEKREEDKVDPFGPSKPSPEPTPSTPRETQTTAQPSQGRTGQPSQSPKGDGKSSQDKRDENKSYKKGGLVKRPKY